MNRSRDVLVLCYHGVSRRWPDSTAVGPERLRAQVEDLLRRGWRASAFTEAVREGSHPRTLVVTFDDALRSVAQLAFPVLRELGVPATVFVPTGFVGTGPFAWPETEHWLGGEHAGELEGMSWEELAGLREAGWEIGSHAASHVRLTGLDEERLAAELRTSKASIEEQLGECRSIAYPYSDVDDRVAAAAQAAGYEAGAAVLPTGRHGDPMRFPRVPVVATEGRLAHRLHVSRPVRRLQATGPWRAVRRRG